MRLLILALVLLPLATQADTATVHVTASIASWATVEADGDCGLLASNDADAVGWIGALPLVPNGYWACLTPPVMYAEAP